MMWARKAAPIYVCGFGLPSLMWLRSSHHTLVLSFRILGNLTNRMRAPYENWFRNVVAFPAPAFHDPSVAKLQWNAALLRHPEPLWQRYRLASGGGIKHLAERHGQTLGAQGFDNEMK